MDLLWNYCIFLNKIASILNTVVLNK